MGYERVGNEDYSLKLPTGQYLKIFLFPNGIDIGSYPMIRSYSDHFGRHLVTSLLYRTAALYTELTNGSAVQLQVVTGCKSESGANILVADYPDMPLSFETICPGNKQLLKGESFESIIF